MTAAILCRDLKKTYLGRPPVEAVRGIDLEVRVGECFGVLGPNGAGKTTTIEILEGLLAPTSGSVQVLGHSWSNHPEAIRQQIGVSLQATELAERLTVRETLTLFRSFYRNGIEPDQAIAIVSLQDKARSWIKKLSGGQKQRLAVACALIGDPRLLFLDEPTTGLDPASRRELWDILRQFRSEGRTILLTTHYMDEAERLCDRVAIIDRGTVIALGTPTELMSRLGGEHVVEFSGADGVDLSPLVDRLRGIPGVVAADAHQQRIRLQVDQLHRTVPPILETVTQQAIQIHDLVTRQASLEDVFVQITGHEFENQPSEATKS